VSGFNVLLSSAGRRVALLQAFRRALARLELAGGVFAADASRLSSAFHLADRAFPVPPCTDPSFIPAMLELCERWSVRLLVPTIDTELPVYAAHRERFAAKGTVVAISSPEVIRVGADKTATHAWLARAGFPTVRQGTVEEVLAEPGGWPWPLVAKPAFGSSSIGVAVVRSRDELVLATRGGGFVVQTVAAGAEHTIDLLASRDGRCVCAVPRRRLETRGGEVSKAMTVRSPPLERLAHQLCEALPGAYGTLNVQVFDDGRGGLTVIEMNPRFGGGYPLSWEAGADFPRWMIEEIAGRPSTAAADGWRDRLVMLRYDDAAFVDASAAGIT